METNAIQTVEDTKQYIVVKLGNEQYGIDIGYIDNIVRMQMITRVPKAQPYFKGVINLRGEIIPVMSIRVKLNLEEDQFTNATRIIIIKTNQQALIGIIVDEVKEVVTLSEVDVEKVAYDGNAKDEMANYLSGVGKMENELLSILKINTVNAEKTEKENG